MDFIDGEFLQKKLASIQLWKISWRIASMSKYLPNKMKPIKTRKAYLY